MHIIFFKEGETQSLIRPLTKCSANEKAIARRFCLVR